MKRVKLLGFNPRGLPRGLSGDQYRRGPIPCLAKTPVPPVYPRPFWGGDRRAAFLLKHLKKNKCILDREGTRHSLFRNIVTAQTSTVPRHTEVDDFLAKKICKDLGVSIIR
jgi:hypothetical protein